ncbi:hypothetical protein WA158_006300 [Blastocystis sp. Blastoise]
MPGSSTPDIKKEKMSSERNLTEKKTTSSAQLATRPSTKIKLAFPTIDNYVSKMYPTKTLGYVAMSKALEIFMKEFSTQVSNQVGSKKTEINKEDIQKAIDEMQNKKEYEFLKYLSE